MDGPCLSGDGCLFQSIFIEDWSLIEVEIEIYDPPRYHIEGLAEVGLTGRIVRFHPLDHGLQCVTWRMIAIVTSSDGTKVH